MLSLRRIRSAPERASFRRWRYRADRARPPPRAQENCCNWADEPKRRRAGQSTQRRCCILPVALSESATATATFFPGERRARAGVAVAVIIGCLIVILRQRGKCP